FIEKYSYLVHGLLEVKGALVGSSQTEKYCAMVKAFIKHSFGTGLNCATLNPTLVIEF
ncbi:hypothetical protein J1N35_010438, partial [Gossypium stocksii]